MTAKNFTDPGAVIPCECAGIFYFVEYFLLCFPFGGSSYPPAVTGLDRQGQYEGGARGMDRKKHPGCIVLGEALPAL